MKYPALLALPVLMIVDYYATLLGAVWQQRVYGRHFTSQHYELNPVWQDAVAERKWFNPRHLALAILTPAALTALLQIGSFPDLWARGLVGAVLGVYAVLLGRHVGNLMIFRYFENHPEEAAGSVSMAHPLVLAISGAQLAVAVLPLALIAVLTANPYATGGALGALVLALVHLGWLRRAKSRQQ